MGEKILIVDDDIMIGTLLGDIIETNGYRYDFVKTGKDALKKLEMGAFYDLIFLDIRLPDINGVDLMKRIRRFLTAVPIVIVTGYADVSNAIESLKIGAIDYLEKPFDVADIERILKSMLGEPKKEDWIFEGMVGKSEIMKKIFHTIEKVAPTNSTVLVEGETGTGKELVAEAIHNLSDRREGPFVKINCAAIPAGLLESELFGHEKGAFTGANDKYEGKFVLANKGTLLLDEIGDMDLGLQAKLLRTLQEKEVMPIGGNKPIKVDVRVIATTNADLKSMVEKGKFRKDLYYRLNVIQIVLPPLRERAEDIGILAQYFVKEFSKGRKYITEEAIEFLKALKWEGNVRELRNLMERVSLIVQGNVIDRYHFESEFSDESQRERSEYKSLKDVEKEHILNVLKGCDFNKTRAAKILGITPKTLRNKMKEYGIEQ